MLTSSENERQDAPWMMIALRELGVREHAGTSRDNPRIVQYLATVQKMAVLHDETPWCSAFVNWTLKQAGVPGTGRANARSWLNYGKPIQQPQFGSVAVLWREQPNSEKGHVAFYCGPSGSAGVWLLGGNQSNCVSIQHYPNRRVLAYRWPLVQPAGP